jgi:hypothetical protein
VDDPEGFQTELVSDLRAIEDRLDLWLISGAESFPRDPELQEALLTLARHTNTRHCLLLLQAILDTPGLAERLMEVLKPAQQPVRNGAEPAPGMTVLKKRRR